MTDENAAEILNSLPKRISDVISRWTEVAPDWPCLVEASWKVDLRAVGRCSQRDIRVARRVRRSPRGSRDDRF